MVSGICGHWLVGRSLGGAEGWRVPLFPHHFFMLHSVKTTAKNEKIAFLAMGKAIRCRIAKKARSYLLF